jgi:hypothetical protein
MRVVPAMNCLHAMRVENSVLYRERTMTTDGLNKAPAILRDAT